MTPRVYWPRTTSSGWMGAIARSTFTFSSRMASASNELGGSMVSSDTTCSTWFCRISRNAPTSS